VLPTVISLSDARDVHDGLDVCYVRDVHNGLDGCDVHDVHDGFDGCEVHGAHDGLEDRAFCDVLAVFLAS
jgi:hypothetical protein